MTDCLRWELRLGHLHANATFWTPVFRRHVHRPISTRSFATDSSPTRFAQHANFLSRGYTILISTVHRLSPYDDGMPPLENGALPNDVPAAAEPMAKPPKRLRKAAAAPKTPMTPSPAKRSRRSALIDGLLTSNSPSSWTHPNGALHAH